MNKPNKETHRYRVVVPGGGRDGLGGGRRMKWVKGINQTFGGKHTIVYTEVEIQCSTLGAYTML